MRRILILCFLFIQFTAFGQTQQALNFDGANDYVSINTGSNSLSGTFSIEGWFYPTNLTGDKLLWGSRQPTEHGFDVKFTGSTLIHGDIGNGSNWLTTTADATVSLTINTWYHVAYVVTPTTYTIYLNGDQVGSGSYASSTPLLFNSAHTLYFGYFQNGASPEIFQGDMDEIRIWNTARTQAEIRNNMRREISNSSTGLVAYYKFNSTSGTTLTESTSNGYNGTLINFALTGSTSNWVASHAGFTPTITSISSNSGVVGTSVTITGTNFNQVAANNLVYFGSMKAGTPTSASTTSLTVTIPTGATLGNITVLNSSNGLSGTSINKFSPLPSVSKSTLTSADVGTRIDISSGIPSNNWIMTSERADFDGDGKIDVANSNWANSTFPISVYRNTSSGSGNFSFASSITLDPGVNQNRTMATADMDGDGKVDLIVGCDNASRISVFRNTSTVGNISFASRVDFNLASGTSDIAAADIDDDGRIDIVAVCGSSISILLNKSLGAGSISMATKVDISGSSNQLGIAVADISGDGLKDILTANQNNAATLSIYKNQGSVGNLSFASAITFTNSTFSASFVTTFDADGDGLLDVFLSTSGGLGAVTAYRNTSSGNTISLGSATNYTMNWAPGRIGIGDYNGDGLVDIVAPRGGMAGYWRNNSTSGSINFNSYFELPANGQGIGTGFLIDLDNDGRLDFYSGTDGGGTFCVWPNSPTFFYSQGSGNPSTTSNWNSRANGSGSAPANMAQATAYIIQNGHTMTTTGAFSFGTSGSVLQIQNGGTFTASHVVTMASGSALTIESGGTFNSNVSETLGAINMVGGKLNIAAGTTLTLNGAVTSTAGVFSGSATSDLTIGAAVGSLLFDQATPGSTNMFRNFTIGSGGTASVTLGNALVIAPTGYVAFNASGTKTLTTGGNLTLRSTSAGTAAIRNTNGATITGNVTVERFVPNTRRAFRFLASPVTTSNIWSNWQESGNSPAGYGVFITGVAGVSPGGNDNTTGLDRTVHGNNSMFTCSASSWSAITNTKTTALTTGVGYRIFVRGDRTIDLYATPDATPNNTTLRATGTLATGDFSTATLPTGYALVGNPYASEIDWNASGWNTIRSNANISNAIYIYRPAIASSATANANQYAAYVGGTGTNGGVQYIASGQAFFIQVTSGTPVLSFTEAYKTNTGATGLFKKAPLVNHLRVGYAKDNEHVDEIVVRFMPDAKMVFDHNYDANSLNSEVFGLYSIKDTNHLAIQGRPDFAQEDVVRLSVNADVTGNFSLKFSETETFDKDIEIGLKDKFLGKTFAVQGNSSYPFSITSDANSKGNNRFELVFTRTANGLKTNMEEISAFSLYPNPASKEVSISLNRKLEGVCAYVVLNELGQEQMTGSLEFGSTGAQSIQVDQLASGVYFVRLEMNNAIQTIKFIK